jgi:hypothetical protein
MSTARPVQHDADVGDALGGHVEIVGEISRAIQERGAHEAKSDFPCDPPAVGTEAFEVMNRRRIELIQKDTAGQLSGPERDELDRLERLCKAAVDKAFPLPPIDFEPLIQAGLLPDDLPMAASAIASTIDRSNPRHSIR